MYTSFDLDDLASSHDSKIIPQDNIDNRNYLKEVMLENGFEVYEKSGGTIRWRMSCFLNNILILIWRVIMRKELSKLSKMKII